MGMSQQATAGNVRNGELDSVSTLVAHWRYEAGRLRTMFGAEPQAITLETCARELEELVQTTAFETLTLEQAAQESGLSYSALEKAVRSGRIPNAGEKGKPRLHRRDLPRKGARSQPPATNDLASRVLAGRHPL